MAATWARLAEARKSSASAWTNGNAERGCEGFVPQHVKPGTPEAHAGPALHRSTGQSISGPRQGPPHQADIASIALLTGKARLTGNGTVTRPLPAGAGPAESYP